MNQQTSEEPNNQQPLTEDLTVNEDTEAAVKGGPGVKTVRFKPGKDLQP
jgi:hypothetical protein